MTTLTTPSPLPALEEATCIVCLESLAKPDTRTKPHTAADDVKSHELTTEGCNLINSDIAYLVPCEHHLHDACLKPWVERANSCPVCRQRFNLVKLVTHVGGRYSAYLLHIVHRLIFTLQAPLSLLTRLRIVFKDRM